MRRNKPLIPEWIHYAGAAIKIEAALAAQGLPVQDASVRASVIVIFKF